MGFSIENIEEKEQNSYYIHFKKTHSVDVESIDPISWDLLELAEKYESRYDGWGSPVCKEG